MNEIQIIVALSAIAMSVAIISLLEVLNLRRELRRNMKTIQVAIDMNEDFSLKTRSVLRDLAEFVGYEIKFIDRQPARNELVKKPKEG